jgi:hypothetical protein
MSGRLARVAVIVGALVLIGSACRGLPAGPSLGAVIVSALTLQPTVGNPALCCCRVVGSVRNDNDVAIHATFKFSGIGDNPDDPIATILYFVSDFEPRTTRPIDAHGFIFPCTAIRRLETELDVKGLAFPPL